MSINTTVEKTSVAESTRDITNTQATQDTLVAKDTQATTSTTDTSKKTASVSSKKASSKKKASPEAIVAEATAKKTSPESTAAEATAPAKGLHERRTLILTNCTDSPRGIAFRKGIVLLEPREMRTVPADDADEVRAMFACATFQCFVDNGIFRLSELGDDEQSTVVKTPTPPDTLAAGVTVDSLQQPVSTTTGSLAKAPRIVEFQSDQSS